MIIKRSLNICKRLANKAANYKQAQEGKSNMFTKLHINRGLVIILVTTLALMANGMSLARGLSAAPTSSVSLPAVQDSYTDINAPTTNFDDGLLNVANSLSAPGSPDVTTKYTFLKFDLSSVSFEIKSAVLSLATLTCGGEVAVDEVNVAVYGVDNAPANAWSETTLTWNTQPPPTSTYLISLNAGALTAGSAQWARWMDGSGGALAAWLETQRLANDASATLVLAIENSSNPGLADVFFEDREGSGAAYGCADVLGTPQLTLYDNFATDLSIVKERVGAKSVTAGERITYTLSIASAGTTVPVTATVVDTWTPVTAVVGVDAPGCDTTNWAAGVITCTQKSLGPGSVYLPNPYLVLTSSADFSGILINTASITTTGSVMDVYPGNNAAAPVITFIKQGNRIYLPLVIKGI